MVWQRVKFSKTENKFPSYHEMDDILSGLVTIEQDDTKLVEHVATLIEEPVKESEVYEVKTWKY